MTFAAVALLGAALATACGSSKAHPGAVPGAQGYRVTYALQQTGGGDQNFDKLQVITDGRAKVKMTDGNGEQGYTITDGTRAFQVNRDAGDKYWEQTQVSAVPRFVVHDSDGTLAAWCANAQAAGTADVLKRTTRHYTCPEWNPNSDETVQVQELWVDQQTGLILRWTDGDSQATASAIDLHAAIPPDTLVLEPPSGAPEQAHPGLPKFQVPRIGGGQLTAATYQGAPLVIVTGDAAGIRAFIDRLLPLTGGGKSPQVIALLKFDDFGNWNGSLLNPADVAALAKSISASAGTFKVPAGIDFKGALGSQLNGSNDATNHVTDAVLIDRGGTVVRVAVSTATDNELRGWIGAPS
jgi:hypothetical protein